MKRNVSLLLCLTLLFFISCKKEDCGPTVCTNAPFNKVYGGSSYDDVNSLLSTSEGGYLFAGGTGSRNGDVTVLHGEGDAWVVKLNCKGQLQWQKTFGGSSSEHASQVVATKDGGYLFAGNTYSIDGDVIGNHGENDAWLVKLNKDGNKIWQKTFGEARGDFAASVTAAPGGGYVVLIDSDADASGHIGDEDIWVVKIDENGNQLWKTVLAGADYDLGQKVIVSNDNGFILAGSSGTPDGGTDALVVKLDANGAVLWKKKYGGSNTEEFRDIISSQDGGYVLTGLTNSFNGDVIGKHRGGDLYTGAETSDIWVVKINENGNITWQKPLGGTKDDQSGSIVKTTTGKYVIAGTTSSNDEDVSGNHGSSDAWIAELDNAGILLWQKAYGGTGIFGEGFYGIITVPGVGYVAAGNTDSNNGDISGNHGDSDAWIITINR